MSVANDHNASRGESGWRSFGNGLIQVAISALGFFAIVILPPALVVAFRPSAATGAGSFWLTVGWFLVVNVILLAYSVRKTAWAFYSLSGSDWTTVFVSLVLLYVTFDGKITRAEDEEYKFVPIFLVWLLGVLSLCLLPRWTPLATDLIKELTSESQGESVRLDGARARLASILNVYQSPAALVATFSCYLGIAAAWPSQSGLWLGFILFGIVGLLTAIDFLARRHGQPDQRRADGTERHDEVAEAGDESHERAGRERSHVFVTALLSLVILLAVRRRKPSVKATHQSRVNLRESLSPR